MFLVFDSNIQAQLMMKVNWIEEISVIKTNFSDE